MNNALGVNSVLSTQKVKAKPMVVINKNRPVHLFYQIEGEGTEAQPYIGVLYCTDGSLVSHATTRVGHWGIFNPADQKDSIITGGNEAQIEAGTHGGLLYTIDITVHGYAWTEGTYNGSYNKNFIIDAIADDGTITAHAGGIVAENHNELGVILSNEETPAKCEFYIY